MCKFLKVYAALPAVDWYGCESFHPSDRPPAQSAAAAAALLLR